MILKKILSGAFVAAIALQFIAVNQDVIAINKQPLPTTKWSRTGKATDDQDPILSVVEETSTIDQYKVSNDFRQLVGVLMRANNQK